MKNLSNRSKSFLFPSKSDFLNFGLKKNSVNRTSMQLKEPPILDSQALNPFLEVLENEADSNRPSLANIEESSMKHMEDLYNYNKSIKLKNGKMIENFILPHISKTITSDSSNNGSPLMKNSIRKDSLSCLVMSPLLYSSKRKDSIATSISSIMKKTNIINFSEESFVDTLKRILSKKHNERNEDDINTLVKILSQIKFFETLGVQKEHNLIEKCGKFMNIEFYPKGNTVFQYGSVGTKFYIILQGSVSVLTPKFGKLNSLNDFHEVKILKDGDSFGELALISKKTRSASILCKEDCYFAVLEKKHFYETLLEFEEMKLQNSINFLRKYKIFNNWSHLQLTSLFLSSTEHNYKRNHTVFKQGEMINQLYFVKSGEFEYKKEIAYFDLEKYQEFPTLPEVLKNNYALRRSKRLEVPITKFAAGSLVGDESFFLNKEVQHTLYSMSDEGTIIILQKAELFNRWNIETFKSMINNIKEQCLKKEEKYELRLEEYLNCIKNEKKQNYENKLKTTFFTFKEDEIIKKPNKNNISVKNTENELSKTKSLSLHVKNKIKFIKTHKKQKSSSLIQTFCLNPYSNEKEKTQLKNADLQNSENQYNLKNALKKYNQCKKLKGLSIKRSNTLMVKVMNDLESLIHSYQMQKTQNDNNNSNLNYSLTKRNSLDLGNLKVSDPYCLISILNPKTKREMEATSERCKLLRKKL